MFLDVWPLSRIDDFHSTAAIALFKIGVTLGVRFRVDSQHKEQLANYVNYCAFDANNPLQVTPEFSLTGESIIGAAIWIVGNGLLPEEISVIISETVEFGPSIVPSPGKPSVLPKSDTQSIIEDVCIEDGDTIRPVDLLLPGSFPV